jgi:hypothetical protein
LGNWFLRLTPFLSHFVAALWAVVAVVLVVLVMFLCMCMIDLVVGGGTVQAEVSCDPYLLKAPWFQPFYIQPFNLRNEMKKRSQNAFIIMQLVTAT